mgnify:CR=1 FL=1|jgi:hypothetical protein
MAAKPRYLKHVQFLASPDMYARIVEAADFEDVQLSEFMRAAIKDRLLLVEGRSYHGAIYPSAQTALASSGAD